jgi:hypothetical protein
MTLLQTLYDRLILRPVTRWYLIPLGSQFSSFNEFDQHLVLDQAIIGWLQTVLLVVTIAQTLFVGVLVALPPDLRAALSFLHRIEWAAYVGILLVGLQAVRGFAYNLILTNRFYVLGWRFGRMQIVRGRRVRTLVIIYMVIIGFMAVAVFEVRLNGFIFRPTP